MDYRGEGQLLISEAVCPSWHYLLFQTISFTSCPLFSSVFCTPFIPNEASQGVNAGFFRDLRHNVVFAYRHSPLKNRSNSDTFV